MKPRPSLSFGRGMTAALLFGLAILAALAFRGVVSARADFYNNLWAPAHLLLQGANPYDTSSLKAELAPLWLPPAVGAFAPLGWLSAQAAARLWALLSLAALALTAALSLEPTRPILTVLAAGLMAFFFPPVINHLALGQYSILAALLCLLAALYAERKWAWGEAFLLALGLAKPQLAFLAAAGLAFLHLHEEGLRGLVKFGLRLAAAVFFLSLPVLLARPGWLPALLADLQGNPPWPQPSLFTFLKTYTGAWAWPLWGLPLTGALLACRWLWRRLPPQAAMPWTLGLTVLVSPYIWSWDFVLLLPLFVREFTRAAPRRKAWLAVAYLAAWAGMAAIQLSQDYNNLRFWWAPLLLMGALLPGLRADTLQGDLHEPRA